MIEILMYRLNNVCTQVMKMRKKQKRKEKHV